jgi:CBS domain-containing protein
MTRLVRDLMRPTLISCPPGTTLGQAAALLIRHRVHALVVAEPEGEPLGLLSDIDLLAGEWLSANAQSLAAMRAMTAGELMTKPVQTIEASAAATEAAQRLQRERVHRLVVTESGKAVGVISVSDLVASLGHAPTQRKTVADVMSRGLVVCLEDTPLPAAARAMTDRRSRSVVVVNAHGAVRGVVTGWDLLSADPAVVETVAELMHPPVRIGPQASLREAADQMLTHHIHRLLVTDPARLDAMPLGLISTSDILAEMAEPGSVWQSTDP